MTPFPMLFDEPVERWQWPSPPFAWPHRAPDPEIAQSCAIETPSGETVEGLFSGMDPAAGTVRFRSGTDGPVVNLAFARIRRLVLTTPLRGSENRIGGRPEPLPASAVARDYRLVGIDGQVGGTGRSVGHVESAHGLFLFCPGPEDATLLRVFVPRSAYGRCEFVVPAPPPETACGITTPRELLAALERQKTMQVRPIGQSLLELGLLTQAQLDAELARKPADLPLGQALLARGLIDADDLQQVIAHKMGYPFVDLTRFPIDGAASRKLPARQAAACRALPIMLHGEQLIVAMDRPARAPDVQAQPGIAPLRVVPVLASKKQLAQVLSSQQRDMWSSAVSMSSPMPLFGNTTF